jgi:hypothetical protein
MIGQHHHAHAAMEDAHLHLPLGEVYTRINADFRTPSMAACLS